VVGVIILGNDVMDKFVGFVSGILLFAMVGGVFYTVWKYGHESFSNMLERQAQIKEQRKELDLARNLTNEQIEQMALPCTRAGLGVFVNAEYSPYLSHDIVVDVTCMTTRQTTTEPASDGVSAGEAVMISGATIVGAKLLGL
jgi:hypothetical protein